MSEFDDGYYEEDEEEEEMLVDYCVNCGNPILEGDVYEYDDEGEILCEDCWRDLHGDEEL